MEFKDYKKYRWFYTSSDKLVVGGKSAQQNDFLLKYIKKEYENFLVMHTSSPGSPFSVIFCDIKSITKDDKEEMAVFTACFSQAWKSKSNISEVHSFELKDISKLKNLKTGTWNVKKINDKIKVNMALVLVKQKEVFRAVPIKTAKNQEVFFKIFQGNMDKKDLLPKISLIIDNDFNNLEMLACLPAGGIRITK